MIEIDWENRCFNFKRVVPCVIRITVTCSRHVAQLLLQSIKWLRLQKKARVSSGCRNNVSSFNFAQTLEGCALCTLCIYSISWETSSSAFPAWRAFKDFQSIYGYGCLHCRRGARGKADLETVRIFKSWFQMLRSSLRWMLSLNPTNVNQCNSQSLLEPLPPNFHYLLLFQPRFYPPFTAVHFGRPLSFKSTFFTHTKWGRKHFQQQFLL